MKGITEIRCDFPILKQKIGNKPLVYFDNGATSQKPLSVIKSIENYYCEYNSNIHRGVHSLSQRATSEYEAVRGKVMTFLNACREEEIIFTSGTTGGINLLASCLSETVGSESEILISAMEHHSNIVPWQMLCERKGAKLKVIPVLDNGELDLEGLKRNLGSNTAVVALTHVSNTLGTINPVKMISTEAKKFGAKVVVDGAQAVPHLKVDVQDLNCDFYVFSAHKMYGPTGVGVLYGKFAELDLLPPYQGGGDMIKEVTFKKTTYNMLPHRLEAGTPNIAGGIGLGAAIDYINGLGIEFISGREDELCRYAHKRLSEVPGIKFYGLAKEKAAVISFLVDGVHPFDLGTLLDQLGIAVRTGHHCTQPLMDRFNIPGTVRASISFYNTTEEIDQLVSGVKQAVAMLV